MPGIVAFGRRWIAASDELVFPFGICVVLRLAWLTLICIIFGIHAQILHTDPGSPIAEVECKGKVNIYLVGYIVVLVIIAIMDALICYSSSRGTVFQVSKRSAVVPLLYIRAALLVIELIWQVLGFVWMFSSVVRHSCHSVPTKRLAQGVVIFNFLFMIGTVISIYIDFDTAGRLWPKLLSAKSREQEYGAIHREIRAKYERKWEKSCKALFCCTKVESSQENVFGFVSRLLSEYFQEYLDLVPSDIVAGLILLRRHQKILEAKRINLSLKEEENCNNENVVIVKKGQKNVRRHQKTGSAKSFDYKNLTESKIFEDIVHFSSYALAIYGWPFYLYDRILCGACTLCCKVRCCASCCGPSKKDFSLIEDNCCECNIEATKLFLNDHDHELIYVSYKDEVYKPPFFVAVDHKKRSVIISCRGTLSLKDVLTDVMIEEERIPVENGDPNLMGHKGMIQSAKFVLDVIMKEELLERAFNCDTERGSQSYSLTIVGHSLGAGVASILAFLLRPKYPNLICFAYSAVGATFNYAASKHARDFIYSIVVGKDVIGRLNLHTLDELRYMIIELLQRSNLPKWKILRGCLCQCMLCCQPTSRNSHEDYLDYECHDIPPYDPESCKRYYMGGKVVHIVKTQSIYPRWIGKKKAVYEAVWADVEDFQSILISNLMWKDHVPDTVKEALHSCWKQADMPKENGTKKEAERPKAESSHGPSKSGKSDEEVHLLSEPDEEEMPVAREEDLKITAADTTDITKLEEDTKQSEEEMPVAKEEYLKITAADTTDITTLEEDTKQSEEEMITFERIAKKIEEELRESKNECKEDVNNPVEEPGKHEEDVRLPEEGINAAVSMEFVEISVEEVKQSATCEVLVETEHKIEVIPEPEKLINAVPTSAYPNDVKPVEILTEDVKKTDVKVDVPEVNCEESEANANLPDVKVESSEVSVASPDDQVEAPDVNVVLPDEPKIVAVKEGTAVHIVHVTTEYEAVAPAVEVTNDCVAVAPAVEVTDETTEVSEGKFTEDSLAPNNVNVPSEMQVVVDSEETPIPIASEDMPNNSNVIIEVVTNDGADESDFVILDHESLEGKHESKTYVSSPESPTTDAAANVYVEIIEETEEVVVESDEVRMEAKEDGPQLEG